jgi:hypothetical protein
MKLSKKGRSIAANAPGTHLRIRIPHPVLDIAEFIVVSNQTMYGTIKGNTKLYLIHEVAFLWLYDHESMTETNVRLDPNR